MAQYDPLELAAYLKQARDPLSGFTPSFTDQDLSKDNADPYAFDVRSRAERELGAHIDPVTGLPVGTAKQMEEDPLRDDMAKWANIDSLNDVQTVLDQISRTEEEQLRHVTRLNSEARTKYGVDVAEQNLQSLVGLPADHPMIQQYASRLRTAQAAANLEFGVTPNNELLGSKAEKFRPYEARLNALDRRLQFVQKLESQQEQRDKETRALEQDRNTIYGKLGISDQAEKRLEERLGAQSVQDLLAASTSEGMTKFLQDVAYGRSLGDPSERIAQDPAIAEPYLRLATEGKTEEEAAVVTDAITRYSNAANEVAKISDKELFADDPNKWASLLAGNDTDRKEAIKAKRSQKAIERVNTESKVIKANMMGPENYVLSDKTIFTDMQQVASKTLASLIQELFGTNNLTDIDIMRKAEPRDFELRMLQVRRLYNDTLPGESEDFNATFELMLRQLTSNINKKGQVIGVATTYKDDPTIVGLRQVTSPLFGVRTFLR